MASASSESIESKPQARHPPSAQERIQTQKSKEESKPEQMTDTLISGSVENSSFKPRSHHEGDRERHPHRDHHRFAGGQRKRQYPRGEHRYRDQGAYHNRKGRQQPDQLKEISQEKASNKDESVKDYGSSHGADIALPEVVGGDRLGKVDSQETEQREGSNSKRGRNRYRQRKRGVKEPTGGTQKETEHSGGDIVDKSGRAGEDSNPPTNGGESGRGRSGGASSASSGRRPRRSERDQQLWRSEQRQRPPREEERKYYRNNRDRWRGDERRDSPISIQKRSQDGDSKKNMKHEQEGATCSNSTGDQNIKDDTKVVSNSEDSIKPEPERKTAERAGGRSQSSKPKSYDYTKPRHRGNDFPSSSKYRGQSQHRLKAGNKEFTPTIQSDELSQQLTAETYECMVCCERVRERDQIWSCQNCYHIFHLKCIKKWATAPTFVSTEEGKYIVHVSDNFPNALGSVTSTHVHVPMHIHVYSCTCHVR